MTAILERVQSHGWPAKFVAADLALGAWQPNAAARQIAHQLGIAVEDDVEDPRATPRSTGEKVGDFVDREAEGEQSALAAQRWLERVLEHLPDNVTVIVVLPRFGNRLDDNDRRFIEGLLRRWSYVLVDDGSGDEAVAAIDPGVFAVCPGVFDSEWVDADSAASGAFLPLLGNEYLLLPELRRDPAAAPAAVTQLGEYNLAPWRRAFTWFHGGQGDAASAFLCRQGWACARDGSSALAAAFFERAATIAFSPEQRAEAAANLQVIRVASLRYRDAAAGVSARNDQLSLLQAWGKAMSGEADQAAAMLEGSRSALRNDPVFALYLDNIIALSELKRGHFERALELELAIESRLDSLPRLHWQLVYVNQLNLARLYKRARDYERSRAKYAAGFATAEGVRSRSDSIYFPFCLAAIDELTGNDAAALAHLLASAATWLSLENPRMLAPRVAAAITGRKLDHEDRPEPADVASALLRRLRESSEHCGIRVNGAAAANAARFVWSQWPSSPHATLVGANGWSLTSINATNGHSEFAELSAFTDALIRRLAEWDGEATTWAVHDNLGRGMAGSRSEVLDVAARTGIREVHFAGRRETFGEDDLIACRRDSVAAPSGSVASIDWNGGSCSVVYKRYRPPLHLEAAMPLLRRIASSPQRVFDLDDADGQTLRELEDARVIEVRLPQRHLPGSETP